MKFVAASLFADPDAAACKLVEITQPRRYRTAVTSSRRLTSPGSSC